MNALPYIYTSDDTFFSVDIIYMNSNNLLYVTQSKHIALQSSQVSGNNFTDVTNEEVNSKQYVCTDIAVF